MKKVQDYFLYFMFYSVIGWIYEVFWRWSYTAGDIPTGVY